MAFWKRQDLEDSRKITGGQKLGQMRDEQAKHREFTRP
jgi:hypothetical protein